MTTFFSIRFSISGFVLRSLIHLDLNFVQDEKYGTIYIYLHTDCPFDQQHLLNITSFSILYFLFLCQRPSVYKCIVLFLSLQFYSIDQLVCLCTFTIQLLSVLPKWQYTLPGIWKNMNTPTSLAKMKIGKKNYFRNQSGSSPEN